MGRPYAPQNPTTSGPPALRFNQGFTLVEIMIVIGIVGLIASIAVPGYNGIVDRGRIASAIADIKRIEMTIERFHTQNGRLPDDLVEVGRADLRDPWGNPFQYLLIEGMPNSIRGSARKDRNLVPINNDYDLYSRGKDGDSKKPLVAPQSHDDIVRARNGGWVGLAVDF